MSRTTIANKGYFSPSSKYRAIYSNYGELYSSPIENTEASNEKIWTIITQLPNTKYNFPISTDTIIY